jgi:hypothetical protein
LNQVFWVVKNPKEFWLGLIYIAIGAAAIYFGSDLSMGQAIKMGPAYFPIILSYLLITIGAVSLVRSFIRSGLPVGPFALKGLVLVIVAIALFGFVVRRAGFLIALPLLVIFGSYASKKFRWKSALVMAVVVTIFCILVFKQGLGVPLPILGSWFGQ